MVLPCLKFLSWVNSSEKYLEVSKIPSMPVWGANEVQNTEHPFHISAFIRWHCWNCRSLNQEFCPEGWPFTTSVFLLASEASWLTSYSGDDPGWAPRQHLGSPRAIDAAPLAFRRNHRRRSSSLESDLLAALKRFLCSHTIHYTNLLFHLTSYIIIMSYLFFVPQGTGTVFFVSFL